MATYLTARRHVKNLIGATTLIHSCWTPHDDGPGAHEGHERIEGAREVWNHLVRWVQPRFRPAPDELLRLKSLDDITEALRDVFEGGDWVIKSKVETAAAFEIRKREERRQELEQKAGEIARRYNCSISSQDFITACLSELNRFSDYRHGMREDGLCIGYGVTYEQWSDEYNCSMGDSAEVQDILEWLATECPLLWAKHQESQLS